jgi:hypothetical protein
MRADQRREVEVEARRDCRAAQVGSGANETEKARLNAEKHVLLLRAAACWFSTEPCTEQIDLHLPSPYLICVGKLQTFSTPKPAMAPFGLFEWGTGFAT